MTTTASTQDIAELVSGLRARLGGDEPTPPAADYQLPEWPRPGDLPRPAPAHHAGARQPLVRAVGELRRPQVAVPVAAAVVAAGAGIGWWAVRR